MIVDDNDQNYNKTFQNIMSIKPPESIDPNPIPPAPKQPVSPPKKQQPPSVPLLQPSFHPTPPLPAPPTPSFEPSSLPAVPPKSQDQQGQSQYTESQQSPIQVTIESFTQYFKTHKPVLFVCFDKLKDDLEFRYDKLFQKLKLFVLREKRPYRMFVTIQNYEVDFQSLVDAMQIMDLPIGTYLIFQSNFNDKGGITIEKYKNCFILKANMKKNSEFQNGYCRFGALEVYEILFTPQTLQKEENIVFDSNKELIRAAKWKGYRTFYLSDESLMDGLTEWTNLFSMQDLVFKSDDLAPLSDKIFCQMEKISNKTFESKWKLKDTMGRNWVATADIVGYMIQPDEINFSSELVKIINNMYNSMLIKTLNIQLARLEPSVNFKFPKTVKEKVLLHYLIQESEDLRPITSIDTKFEDILKTGVVSVDGKQYELEGLGGIILVASLFYMNQEIEKIYDSIYIKPNPEVQNTMQAYIRDLRVVFNALKQINVKSEYFFDIQGKRKFSVLDINGLRFLDMNNRIKLEIIEKLNVLKNYLELREHQNIFLDADDKKLKYFEISKKAVFHNLSKRINNLVQCYDGLEVIPEGDILHQIDLILKPHLPFPDLCAKIIAETRLIITGEFPTDINLMIYYLQKAMVGKFKHIKVLNFAEQPENKVKKMLSDCKKSLEEIIFIINYDFQIFTVPLVIHNLIINNKGERSTLVVGCSKKFLPLREIELIAPKHVEINIVEVIGTKISQEIEEPQFNEQNYQVLEQILDKFVPSHKQKFMEMGKHPEFMDFLRTPSMLHQIIQLSKSIEKKKIINLNLLFKIFKQHLELYINEEYGRSTANIVRSEIEILTTEYFTNSKNPKVKGDQVLSYFNESQKIYMKQKEKKYKRGFEYQTLSFLLFEHGTISFKHQMFAAYLATEIIINNELDNYNSDFNCIKFFLSNSMVRLFLTEKLLTLNMHPKLLAIVKQSKYRAHVQTNLNNCGIAVSLLALLQPDLSDQDFAFCQFPDATLEGCNLTRTDFSYANMLNVYFGRANCYETLIFRCKHIGSIQFEEVIDHESINEIKQIVLNDKVAYVLVDGFLETWEYPFNKSLHTFDKISFKKICMMQCYLFGITFDTVYIIDLTTMTTIIELRSKLLIIYDIIVSSDLMILTSNTNCMQQWKWKEYIAAAEKNPEEAYTEKVIYKHSKIFYAMKRVCSIVLGESPYFYIGDAEGNIFKYDLSTLNIVCNYKLMKQGEVLCLGFYQGVREKKLLSFSEDMYLKVFTINQMAFCETWVCKQFQCLKEISMNENLIFALSGHALSIYGKKYIGKPITKLNYYREDGLNFTSMYPQEKSKNMVISHMKGILTVPFYSHDIWRQEFGHQYSITCLLHTKTSIGAGNDKKQIDIIISGGFDMKLNFWKMDDLSILASVDIGCTISQLSVDRNYLLVASQFFYILIYSLENFELVGKLSEFYQGSVNCMRIHDEILFTGSNDRLLIKYRRSDWKYRSKMLLTEAPTYIVCGVDYIECIVGTEYGKILWIDDRNFVKYEMSQHKTAIESIIIDGGVGFSCSSDILVKWEVKTREILCNIIIPASIFTTMSFYKEYIMATIGNSIMFLSRDLKELLKYPVHGGKIRSVIYDVEKERIYSAGDDRCIKKFTVEKGYQRMEFEMSVPKRLACNRIKFN